MKKLFTLLFLICPLFAANYGNEIAVKLDAGVNSFSLTNAGSEGGSITRAVGAPASWARLGVVISPIYVPPTSATTYSTCAAPCSVSMNRQWGQQYIWIVRLDSDGSVHSPFTVSGAASAYNGNICDGAGTLPMIEPSLTTTAPLPMPREVVGQDCYVDGSQYPLRSGHASTGVRQWIRIHSPAYNIPLPSRIDGKACLKLNSSSWMCISNTNSNVTAVDEQRFQVADNNGTLQKVGGYAQVRDYIMAVSNGVIGSSDTTIDQRWKFMGTEGNTSGYRILESFPIESSDKTITQIVCTSNSCVGTSNSHGFSSGESVLIRNAPGMRVLNGPQVLTGVTSNTFTFTPHAAGSGKSAPSIYVMPDGTYTVPINTNLVTDATTAQPVMYATRMLVDATAFTYAAFSESAPGGGNATRGNCLIQYGNTACTPALTDQLVNANMPYLSYTLHNAKCGSCHSPTAADLKFFNFSNESIRQRSVFHGLTSQDGLDIAAAVRGNQISNPTWAAPWNPPFQSGPGMSAGTFSRSATTLTSIVVTSNVGTVTVPGGHGYKTGDPVCVSGATVDTDLGSTAAPRCYPATVTSSTVFTIPTTSVANGTYNESTLAITSSNNAAGGCGIDCVTTYGYKDMYQSLSPTDKTKWLYTSRLPAWEITWPYPFPDWNKGWLPQIFPGDIYPSADFLNSTPYVDTQAFIADLQGASCPYGPTCFAAYKAAAYGSDSGHYAANGATGGIFNYFDYYGRSPGTGTTDFRLPQGGAAGRYGPSIQSLARMSVMENALTSYQWTSSIEYGTFAMDGQRMADIYGVSPSDACYVPWGMAGNSQFNASAPHKMTMYGSDINAPPNGVFEGWVSSWDALTNAWYIEALAVNGRACTAGPDNPIDNQYLDVFLQKPSIRRPNGYASFLPGVVIPPQLGNALSDFAYHGGQALGVDWIATVRTLMPFARESKNRYYWFTALEWTTLVDDWTHLFATIVAAHDATYWGSVMSGIPDGKGTAACPANAASSAFNGNDNVCSIIAFNITFINLFGTSGGTPATDRATILAWAKAVTAWNATDWDAQVSAATRGDLYSDYGTTAGGAIVKAVNPMPVLTTVTFTHCPFTAADGLDSMGMAIGGGADPFEIVNGINFDRFGSTCVENAAGNLKFYAAQDHAAGWKLTYGLSRVNLYPNWNNRDADNATTPWWQGTNMQ